MRLALLALAGDAILTFVRVAPFAVPIVVGALFVDSRRRALQDFLARTVVVYAGQEPPPEPDAVAARVVGDIQPSR